MTPVGFKRAEINRILVIRMGHIGDVVLVTPALGLLNRLFPQAEISVLVRSGTEAMLQNHPLIKRIYSGGEIVGNQQMHKRTKASLFQRLRQIPRGIKLLRELRRRHFDLVVDFSGGDRSMLYAFFSGAPERVCYRRQEQQFFGKHRFYTHVYPDPGIVHKVVKDAALLHSFAIATGRTEVPEREFKPGPLVLIPPPQDLEWAEKRWAAIGNGKRPRVVLHPASRVLYKCWNSQKWAAVISQLQAEFDAQVVVTSGPDSKERELAKAVVGLCPRPIQTQLGDVSLSQLAALIQNADLFLGVDTAPMHIAAGVGTKVIAVFGPSRHEIWAPWGSAHRVVRRPCPCLESGERRCDETAGMECLMNLTAEEVYEAARSALLEIRATAKGEITA